MPRPAVFSASGAAPRARNAVRPFCILLGVYCLGIVTILQSNRFYIDDIGRALYGYAGWFTSARPVAEVFSYLFYMGGTTFDSSPFSQILAAAFLAAAALCLCIVLRAPFGAGTILALIPMGLSPYGLENLSYKFDAPQMSLALLLSVLPYAFFRRGGKTFFFTGLVCLFCAASIYQPTLSAYLAVGCYIMMLHTVSREKSMRLARVFARLALPFCIAMGICAAQTPYWLNRTRSPYIHLVSSMPSPADMPASIAANCRTYARILLEDWGANPLGWLLILLFACFLAFLAGRWLRSRRHAGPASLARLGLLGLLSVCFLLTPIGVVGVLPHPVWAPRAFCGFGTAMALMLLALQGAAARSAVLRMPFFVLSGVLCLQLVIFAQVYGNILTGQNNWERTRIAFMAQGLSRFMAETGVRDVFFRNSVGLTPLAAAPIRTYPLLGHLVVVPLAQGWEWGYEQLKIYGVNVRQPERGLKPAEALTPYLDTPVYRLDRTADGLGVITFKGSLEERLWRHIPPGS